MSADKKLVLFHLGRGGRFHNSGHLTCRDIIDGFDAEHYGINIYMDEDADKVTLDNGEVACSLTEYNSENGTFNIDNDYDTYFWKPISELDKKEMLAMFRDLRLFEFKDALIDSGVDENVLKLLVGMSLTITYVTDLVDKTTFEELLTYSEVLEYETEELAEEYGYDTTVEIDDKFYTIY